MLAGIASPAASGRARAGRSSGESGAQGSHAPAASDCDEGRHSTLLKGLGFRGMMPRSWGQENTHSFDSQASLLRVALATPQMPPPLFLSASQVCHFHRLLLQHRAEHLARPTVLARFSVGLCKSGKLCCRSYALNRELGPLWQCRCIKRPCVSCNMK